MPYKSAAQRRWAHSPTGEKALGGPQAVTEWDRASEGMKLPERAKGGTVGKNLPGQGGRSQLDTNYSESGAIVPGAKPQFEAPTLLDKTMAGVKSIMTGVSKRLNSTGNAMSPSTIHDHANPGKRPTALSDAERDRLSKKFLGG